MAKTILSAILILGVMSCSSHKKSMSNMIVNDREQINSRLGKKFECITNETNTEELCFMHEIEQNVKYISFAIYELNTGAFIYGQSKVRSVKWISDGEVRVDNFTRIPSNELPDDDYYIYDVSKRKITSNKNY